MTTAVSPPLRRALALAILLAVVVLGWSFVVVPLIGLSSDRWDDAAALSDELSHLQAIIARQPELEHRAAFAKTALGSEGGLWTGASAAEVAAAMQDRLGKVIASHEGRLLSTAVAAETLDHGFHRITVRFAVEGVLDTAQATLAAIASARPAMFVDSVVLHATGTAVTSRPPALTMDLDVSGYMAQTGR